MNPTLDAFLRSWPFAPWLAVSLLISAAIYLRGWRLLHRRDPERWHGGRLAAFLGGLAAIYLALASPIEPFASLLLQVHMVQHLLLMMVAPPLLWLGGRSSRCCAACRRPFERIGSRRCSAGGRCAIAFAFLTHPFVAWPIYVGTTWLWHMPRGYELGLSQDIGTLSNTHVSSSVRYCFGIPSCGPIRAVRVGRAGCCFRICSWPTCRTPCWPPGCAFRRSCCIRITCELPRLAGISALDDQATAGVLMWVPGSIALLVAAVLDWCELSIQLTA